MSRYEQRERHLSPIDARALILDAIEIVVAVAIATGFVAALQSTAPPVGLGTIYLLAVLAIAIRRGGAQALATAVLSVLALNFFFIAPRYQLAIAHSQDLALLIVFLIAALVVGRLAATARWRAAQAESRARLAAAREREATLVAEAAAAILADANVGAGLRSIGERVASATGASRARVAIEREPSPAESEIAIALDSRERPLWLYIERDLAWDTRDVERLAGPLGGLIDVALERERVAEQAAETEAARRAEIARTAILHAISHDLRSPLTAIRTAGSALRAPGVTELERDELYDVIETESTRLARLVGDLLDLSRIEAGAVAPQADWCDLHDVVSSSVAHAGRGHAIEFALAPELPLVRADAAQLERVFSNLIENAVKFSPAGAAVRLSSAVDPVSVGVSVSDRGRGIPAGDLAHVFDPFFRGAGAAAGSGLGLAICRGFVEANGGRIEASSVPGGGTTFTVFFPLEPQPDLDAEPGPAAPVREQVPGP